MSNLSIGLALCLFVGAYSVKGETQNKEASIKDFTNELRTRLINGRGFDGQSSYLELVNNILDKIQGISCDKSTTGLEEKILQLTNSIEAIKGEIGSQITELKEDFELKNDFSDLSRKLTTIEEDTNAKINDMRQTLRTEMNDFRHEMANKKESTGTTYIRWGRTSCPGNGSDEIYNGYAGGSHFNSQGAAASMFCLTKHPMWKKYDDALQTGGLMYGAEYDDRYATASRESVITGTNHFEQDVPCAVCHVHRRSSRIMIPGRTACYPGWTMEYWGYLMGGNVDLKAATNYYCVDADQEALMGRGINDNGYLLYFVEGRCGSLPCPPYINGRELTCVVCTK